MEDTRKRRRLITLRSSSSPSSLSAAVPGFRLALHEDEIRFDPTLLQMLKHRFRAPPSPFEDELPASITVDITASEVARQAHQHPGLRDHRADRPHDPFLRQVPSSEGPRRPDRTAQAQRRRQTPDRHSDTFLRRRGCEFSRRHSSTPSILPISSPRSRPTPRRSRPPPRRGKSLRHLRAARDREKVRRRQSHHQLPRPRPDRPLRFAEDRRRGVMHQPHEPDRLGGSSSRSTRPRPRGPPSSNSSTSPGAPNDGQEARLGGRDNATNSTASSSRSPPPRST